MNIKTSSEPGAHVGRSIIEMLWEQLDVKFAKLKEDTEDGGWSAEDIVNEQVDDEDEIQAFLDWREVRGEVRGLAYAIAKLLNPYKPNVDAVREEANKRWTASH
jgi:hypothetical protein